MRVQFVVTVSALIYVPKIKDIIQDKNRKQEKNSYPQVMHPSLHSIAVKSLGIRIPRQAIHDSERDRARL